MAAAVLVVLRPMVARASVAVEVLRQTVWAALALSVQNRASCQASAPVPYPSAAGTPVRNAATTTSSIPANAVVRGSVPGRPRPESSASAAGMAAACETPNRCFRRGR